MDPHSRYFRGKLFAMHSTNLCIMNSSRSVGKGRSAALAGRGSIFTEREHRSVLLQGYSCGQTNFSWRWIGNSGGMIYYWKDPPVICLVPLPKELLQPCRQVHWVSKKACGHYLVLFMITYTVSWWLVTVVITGPRFCSLRFFEFRHFAHITCQFCQIGNCPRMSRLQN